MKKVTTSELAEILMEKSFVKGAAVFANVLQSTDPKLKKTGNPFTNVRKISQLTILLNTEYEKGVLNQLAREEKDATEYEKGRNTMPLQFGENNRFIGYFNGKPVLQYRPFDNSHPKTIYTHNGVEIDKEKIAAFLPAKSAAQNQGTDKEILWRKLYLSNVLEITIDKETYHVVPELSE
jgi:hypothetical protein